MALRRQVGIIYGNVSAAGFELAVSERTLKRHDYVEVESEGHRVLGQLETIERRSSLSFDQAMALPADGPDVDDRLSGSVRVIGYQDAQGRIQTPRSPFRAGLPVYLADENLVTTVLGLEQGADDGAYLGHVKGSRIPVAVSMDTLAQKHVSVLAKTGAGKSYTVAVLLEEFLKANVPLVILDPHGEYGSLRNANVDEAEVSAMVRFKVKPRSFHKQVKEYALDTTLNPDAQRLVLEGMNLEGRDIVAMLGGKISGGQVGVLYQAIKEVKEHLPAYTLRDVMDAVARNKASSRWNVLNALEVLESTKVFDIRGTPVKDLVAPGQCSIINLKGASPDIQEIVVTRLTNMLWEARKRAEVPAHILVVEEAHNFCPERNVANAISGSVIRTVASEGRKFGMGLVIVSQRPAKIDKNVLSQCNTQVVLKVTNPNDLKAIVQSVEGINNEVADEIQRLSVGVALVAGGGLTQPVFVDVRPRLTRHGGKSVSVLHQEAEDDDEEIQPGAPPAPRPSPAPIQPPAWMKPAAVPPPTSAATPAPAAPIPPPPAPSPDPEPPVVPIPLQPPAPSVWKPIIPESQAGPAPEAPVKRTAKARRVLDVLRQDSELPPRSHWSMSDARAIHRVATRVGLVGATQDPGHTIDVLTDLANNNHRDPDVRLRMYREISENACHERDPACIRCPLKDQCLYHHQAQQERQKTRSPLRRLWS
jgi:DNA helicase HerA-like ATPase